jgi:transposase
VDRIKQRRRERGEITPRKQTKFRRRTLSDEQEQRLVFLITAHPDATLAELREQLPTTAALSTLWRAIERLDLTVKNTHERELTREEMKVVTWRPRARGWRSMFTGAIQPGKKWTRVPSWNPELLPAVAAEHAR